MLRSATIALTGIVLAGCSANGRLGSPASQSPTASGNTDTAQAAAFAARSSYPDKSASDDLKAAALIEQDGSSIKLVNMSDQPIRDAKLWVNGTYVARVESIPPRGTVSLPVGQFYDRRGSTLAPELASTARFELQTQDNFYRLMGPVID